MLQIPTWSRVLTLVILLLGFIIALPNALPSSVLERMPHWWPTNTVALGLDLQGGSYLLLEVELDQVHKDRLESMMGDIRSTLRKNHIAYNDVQVGIDSISLRIMDGDRFEDAKALITTLNPSVSSSVLAVGARGYDMSVPSPDLIVMKMTEAYKTQLDADILGQSVEVVRRRIDQL